MLHTTREKLFYNYPHISLWRNIPFLCTFKQKIDQNEALPDSEFTLLWNHPKIDHIAANDYQNYTWLITVWLRINVSHHINSSSNSFYSNNKYTNEKLHKFKNNHLSVIKFLDTFEDPSDDIISGDFITSLLSPLGNSCYSEDFTQWEPTFVEHIQIRETPLEGLKREFPLYEFDPLKISIVVYYERSDFHFDPLRENALKVWGTYTKYIGCVVVLQQLYELRLDHPQNDNLHYFYVAFVDLFYYCINSEWHDMSDTVLEQYMKNNVGISIWDANNPMVDTRAFHAGDLPDLFRTLSNIPLNGEQHKPDFIAAKIIQKSLPFCGQRRKLIQAVCEFTTVSNAFWKLFSKVLWCVLAGMYPEDDYRPDMHKLLRVRQLTDETCARRYLNDYLKIGEYEGSALIVVAAFRRYITYIAQFNEHYLIEARKCIAWDDFEKDTLSRANFMRRCGLENNADVFSEMRSKMMYIHKHVSDFPVYRYKKYSLIKTLVQHCNDTLEKTVYASLQIWISDRACLTNMEQLRTNNASVAQIRSYSAENSAVIWDTFSNKSIGLDECFKICKEKIDWFIEKLSKDIPKRCKENIINVLIKVPKDDRLNKKAIQIIELPKYGGASTIATKTILAMANVYRNNPVPRRFNALIRKLDIYDFKIVCWYLNMVYFLEKINFTIWDAGTVERIDFAMTHKRNVLLRGQNIPKSSFDVYLTLCCSRIATFQGSSYFGHEYVSFDINSGRVACCKKPSKKKKQKTSSHNNHDDTRKFVRNKRKKFNHIPCKGQSIMRINLRGFQLVYGSDRDNLKRYCHCPKCGSFHEFEWCNFAGSKDAKYRCKECKEKELVMDIVYECCYCLARPSKPITHSEALKRSLYIMYPMDEHEPFKLKYFCKKHYKYAKIKSNQLPKKYLWPYIQKKEQKKMFRIAMGFYR